MFLRLLAGTASSACPAYPSNLAKKSIILAAVICEADDPCSVKTAHAPESSFSMSPRSTSRPMSFWCFGSNSAFLR